MDELYPTLLICMYRVSIVIIKGKLLQYTDNLGQCYYAHHSTKLIASNMQFSCCMFSGSILFFVKDANKFGNKTSKYKKISKYLTNKNGCIHLYAIASLNR